MSWLSSAINKVLPGAPTKKITQATTDKWIKPEHKDQVEAIATGLALGPMGIGAAGSLSSMWNIAPWLSSAIVGGAQSWGTGGDPVKGALGGAFNSVAGDYLDKQNLPSWAKGAITGAGNSAISGGDVGKGALAGALSSFLGGGKDKPKEVAPTQQAIAPTAGAGTGLKDFQTAYADVAKNYGTVADLKQLRLNDQLTSGLGEGAAYTGGTPKIAANYQNLNNQTVGVKNNAELARLRAADESIAMKNMDTNSSGFFNSKPAVQSSTAPTLQAAVQPNGGNMTSAVANAAKQSGAGGIGSAWWKGMGKDLDWTKIGLNAIMGYAGGGAEGALSGAMLGVLPEGGPNTQYNNLLAAIRGDLSSRQRGLGGGVGAALSGVAQEEFDKYADPTRYTDQQLADAGKAELEMKAGLIPGIKDYETDFKKQYGRELPGWARGSVKGTFDALGNKYSPVVGAITGGVQGSLGADVDPLVRSAAMSMTTNLANMSQQMQAADAQAAGGGGAIDGGAAGGGTSTTTGGGYAGEDILKRLMEESDYRIDKDLRNNMEWIADEMQRRGLRTSGIHQGALTDLYTQMATARKQEANANVLNTYNSLMQWADKQLDRNQQYAMLKYQAQLAQQQGDTERANGLWAMVGQMAGQLIASKYGDKV